MEGLFVIKIIIIIFSSPIDKLFYFIWYLMIGFPSVGKSTLLSNLAGVYSEVAAYEFTTLTTVPGVIRYKGAKVQLLDLPGSVYKCNINDIKFYQHELTFGCIMSTEIHQLFLLSSSIFFIQMSAWILIFCSFFPSTSHIIGKNYWRSKRRQRSRSTGYCRYVVEMGWLAYDRKKS